MQLLGKMKQRYTGDISLKHLHVLDGVRVLFVFIVAWFHIWQQSWLTPSFTAFGVSFHLDFLPRAGYIFVDGMLLLSGLLLFLPHAIHPDAPFDTLLFYKKRVARIVPSFLLSLLVMMFFVALPEKRYPTFQAGLLDVLTHLTFTHNFFPFSHHLTPLNVALWTLAVEMQFYLIFPLLAKCFKKHPALTFFVMSGIAWAYRFYVQQFPDTTMLVNQFPAFLDVYAIGFVGASLIVQLSKRFSKQTKLEKVMFSCFFLLSAILVVYIVKEQATCPNHMAIRLGQLNHRLPLAMCLASAMVSLCYALPIIKFVFGNKIMYYLSGVSFQYYIWHQVFAVQLKKWKLPPSVTQLPWQTAEREWQIPYTFYCFLGALFIATVVTYAFEKPIAKLWLNHRAHTKRQGGET